MPDGYFYQPNFINKYSMLATMHPVAPFMIAIVVVLVAVLVLGQILCPPEMPYGVLYWWICEV
jgi:hypothetical protein